MSFVGFRSNNHPQQVARRGALDDVDDRRTPLEVIDWAVEILGRPFDLDVAASAENAKAARFYTAADDGLQQAWPGVVWCNPPYSDISPWVRKAWDEFDAGRATSIAMLLPANRTEQKWWQEHIEPRRDQPGACLSVYFLAGRLRFGHPEGWQVPVKGNRPPFGCCLLVWRRTR